MTCEPCAERGRTGEAVRVVAGTPMCQLCFSGEPQSKKEMIGGTKIRGDYYSIWYKKNRKRILRKMASDYLAMGGTER